MRRSPITRLARSIYGTVLRAAARPLPEDQLQRSALVVAPHSDDETLGCGGTVVKKIAAGATVRVVYTTDSGASHRGMGHEELVQRRRHEALAACARLSIGADRVTFLGLPDGALAEHESQAVEKLSALVREFAPQQVFMPYRLDDHPDHEATNRAVLAALRTAEHACTVLEYPVWFWQHWPWMAIPRHWNHRVRRGVKKSVIGPVRMLRDIHWYVDVTDELERKRVALMEHATQMAAQGQGWETLGEISGGEFLELLLGQREWFCRRVVGEK